MKAEKFARILEAKVKGKPSHPRCRLEEKTLENNTSNMVEQLTVESKSLWRIKNNYKRDSVMDMEAKQLWDVIEKDKEELVAMLTEKLRERL